MKNSEKFDLRKFLNDNKIETGTYDKKDVVVTKKNAYNDTKKINEEVSKSVYAKATKLLDQDLKDIPKDSGEYHWFVKEALKGALTDANYHDEEKQVDRMFPKAKLGTYSVKSKLTGKDVSFKGKEKYFSESMEKVGRQISKWSKWDGYDITQIFSQFIAKNIDKSIAKKVEELGYE